MEVLLANLSPEMQTIIRFYNAVLEDKMKNDLEIKLKEKDLEMKSNEKDLATKFKEKVLEMKSKEKDLATKLKEKDLEMKSNEKDPATKLKEKNLEMELKENDLTLRLKEKYLETKLKYEYARQNWEDMKVNTKLDIRSVLELFEKKRLDPCPGMTRRRKYEKFANKKHVIDEVRSSGFTPETFADTVVMLFENLNEAAHPTFQSGDTLMVREEYLSESEWRVLSLIWKLCLLPKRKLQKI